MLLMFESVLSLKEKITLHWFSYFKIASKYLFYLMTDPLNIIFDNFFYKIQFSYLYNKQGCYFVTKATKYR